jgi:hypothetical protein
MQTIAKEMRNDAPELLFVAIGRAACAATEGGVTFSSAASTQVTVGHAGGRTCVAWAEGASVSVEVLLRCTDQ